MTRNENRMKLSQNDNSGVKIYTFVFHVCSKRMQYSIINVLVHLVKKKIKNSVNLILECKLPKPPVHL